MFSYTWGWACKIPVSLKQSLQINFKSLAPTMWNSAADCLAKKPKCCSVWSGTWGGKIWVPLQSLPGCSLYPWFSHLYILDENTILLLKSQRCSPLLIICVWHVSFSRGILNESNDSMKDRVKMIIPILQLRKLKFREVKFLPKVTQLISGATELIKNKQANCECSTLWTYTGL